VVVRPVTAALLHGIVVGSGRPAGGGLAGQEPLV